MNHVKKATSKITCVILAVLVTISGIVMPTNAALAAAPAEAPSQITMGLAGGAEPGKSAMSFNWLTDPSVTVSEIVYGTSPTLADGVSVSATMSTPKEEDIIIKPGQSQKNPFQFTPINSFNVVIQDLIPEQKYYYKVGNEADGYSAIASFTAAADPAANKPFSFVVIPDTQGYDVKSNENTAKMYDHIKENEADAAFLLHMGDVVEDGNVSDEWQYFFDAAQNLLGTLPIMATPGNHDGYSYDQDFIQYKARFDYSSLKKPAGLSEASQGTVYSFEYGDALFISLNSYAVTSEDRRIQWEFLAEEAAATTKAWKIVYFHASPYDPGASHYALDNVTGKKLTDAKIDLVLHGHEHAYARTTLKTTSEAAGTGSIENVPFGEAPTYVIGGSVYNYAYSLHATNDTSWNDFFYDLRINKSSSGGGSINSPGVYSKVDVTSNAITYKTYYKALGADKPFYVIDEFNIVKSGEKITQPTGGGEAPTSVTFLYDSFKQEAGKYIARFNWVTPITTKTTQLLYAKKSDFDGNGGKFTDVVAGSNNTVDLREALENANYNGQGTAYSIAPLHSHKAETAALEPNTEYVYALGDGGRNVTDVETPNSFTTPAIDVDTFNFNWVTDVHAAKGSSHNGKALEQAFTDFPDAAFILSSGDQISYAFDTSQWDAFFEGNADKFARMPLYMGTGNHEYDGAGNSWANDSWDSVDPILQNLLGRYNPPKNGASFYGGGDGTERMVAGVDKMQFESSNYYFVYGDTLFMMMDYQDQSDKAQIKAQQDWMKSVVKQNPTKWRVAIIHKSLFGYRMESPVSTWTDAFDEAGVDLVLMGHDHLYARTMYANGEKIEAENYGDGTTYITSYSGNNDRRGPYFVTNNRDESKFAYVDIRAIGPGFSNISISPDEIKVTSKGFNTSGDLVFGDEDVLVTNKPRTPNLSAWSYPAVPADENELSVTGVMVTGIAKEGQNLYASVAPSSASASIQWERSTNGTTWTAIEGATSSQYNIKDTDVDSYLRAVAKGTGLYIGVVTSAATEKVTALAGNSAETIIIGTPAELAALSEGFGTSDYPVDARYVLSAHIDLSGVEFSAIGGGTAPTAFIGTFDGNGYTISNLTISNSNSLTGFFSYIGTGGKVTNLKLDNADITGGRNTGAIAGLSTGTIENSTVFGKVSGEENTGGIVGVLHGGTLQNSAVSATVIGSPAGGMIGGTNFVSPLKQRDEVTGNIILNNYVAGTVSWSGSMTYVGAIVGDMGGSSGSLLKTFHGNAVTTEVIGADPGKFAGYWSGSRPIIDKDQLNYYDSGKLATSGIPAEVTIGKPASDFALQATYEALGWDFNEIWEWDEVNNIPVLRGMPFDEEEIVYTLTITGGTISVDGNAVGNLAQIEENKQVTVTAVVPSGKRFVKWTAEGLDNESYTANPLTFTMPANEAKLTAVFENIPNNGGDTSNNSDTETVTPAPEAPKTKENTITVTSELVQTSAGRSAVAALTEQAVADAIAFVKAANNTKNTVEIKVEVPAGAKAVDVTVPQKSMTAAAEGQIAGLTIATPFASITFDDATLKAIAEAAKADIKVSVRAVDSSALTAPAATLEQIADRPVFDFSVSSGDEKIADFNGGLVSVSVPYTLKPGENENALVVFYLNKRGNLELVMGRYDAATGTVKMTLSHFSSFVIGYNKLEFADVLITQWYADAVDFVAARKLFNGVGGGKFAPENAMTRAMFAMVIANMEGADIAGYQASAFTDVDMNAWYGQAVSWAAEKNIVSGIGNGRFDPEAQITREQMAVMLYNYMKYKDIELAGATQPAFADASEVSDWAKDAVAQFQRSGIIHGVGQNIYAPQANANRASVATIFTNLIKALTR